MLAATKRTTESYNQCMYDFELGAEWADNHPHWISVKDRLPESNEKEEFGMIGYPTVLVALEDGYVDTSYYDTTQECWGDLPHDMCLCKPYLRSMSSMTAEEKKQYHKLCDVDEEYGVGCNPEIVAVHDTLESLDYLNSIHIDYRGLIPQGLAIEVTEENNPYKD